MTNYEALLCEADKLNIITKEKNLLSSNGRIKGNKVAIRKDLTEAEKSCTMAEELGHYHLTVGNIIDQTNSNNCKQEHIARMWGFYKLIGLQGLVDAFEHHCQGIHEVAEFLDVTEEYLLEAIKAYTNKYGNYAKYKEYVIIFNYNSIGIMKNI